MYELLKRNGVENKIGLLEQFNILLLNQNNRVLGNYEIFTDGTSATVADPKTIFIAALRAGAVNLILAYNHPSGNVKPRQANIELTSKIKDGGRLLEITVLDHLIISKEAFYLMADERML